MRILITVAALLLTPGTVLAASLGCPAPFRPLLEVVSVASSDISLDGAVASGGALLCTGGATTRVDVARDVFTLPGGIAGPAISELPDRIVIVTGTVPPAELAALGQALGAAGVGGVDDCQHEHHGTVDIAQRVTWHGRQGRRNTFTATTDTLGLPPCSTEVEALLGAINLSLLAASSGEDAEALLID